MILINFSHPLTSEQLRAIEQLVQLDAGQAGQAGGAIERILDAPAQFDHVQPFVPQVTALVDGVELTSAEWQTAQILVNPPSLNAIAVTLLAELHGRMGYFPPIVRLRPVQDALPPRFEVAEIINLQAVRDTARKKRI